MTASTKKFTPEIDAALYKDLVALAKQNGQSQRHLRLDPAPRKFLNVARSV